MFTLKDWTYLCLNPLAYAQHFLPTLMSGKRQLWPSVVKDTLYHLGLWVCCQIAEIQLSILLRLVYARDISGASKICMTSIYFWPIYILVYLFVIYIIYTGSEAYQNQSYIHDCEYLFVQKKPKKYNSQVPAIQSKEYSIAHCHKSLAYLVLGKLWK